jgi:hypothetical protein
MKQKTPEKYYAGQKEGNHGKEHNNPSDTTGR